MHSFHVVGIALTGNRTQGTHLKFDFSFVLFLILTNKHSRFGANRFIRSRAIREVTKIRAYNLNFVHKIRMKRNCTIIKIIHSGFLFIRANSTIAEVSYSQQEKSTQY